ncbi:MAG: hypothetical protein ACYC9U_09405 [Nitrososphaerales archaeon]
MAKRGPKGRSLVKGRVFDVLHEAHEKNPDKSSDWLAEKILHRTGKHVSPRTVRYVLHAEKRGRLNEQEARVQLKQLTQALPS